MTRPVGHPEHYAPWLARAHQRARAAVDRLPLVPREFLIFGVKQGWACLFGAIMLGGLIVTKAIWNPAWPIHRYDALLVLAVVTQVIFVVTKLEEIEEAKVIFLFHVVGTVMEVYKTAMGSWVYPEPALIRIGGVPLFTGFMYACVGSYMARVIRLFDMRFEPYPARWAPIVLSVAIYVNFFTHHYTVDVRALLFAAAFVIFWRTRIWFTIDREPRWMPLLVAAFLTSVFLWIAENIGTVTGTWLYPDQKVWRPVSLGKMGSWYLLLIISFVLVTLVHQPKGRDEPPRPARG